VFTQYLGIIVLEIPFFFNLAQLLGVGIDEGNNPQVVFAAIVFLTIGILTFNDWQKIKYIKPITNSFHFFIINKISHIFCIRLGFFSSS